MVTLVALVIWRQPLWVVAPVSLVFLAFDGLYLSSALTKVPHGAWFTLCLAGFLSSIFVLWRFGKQTQWTAEADDTVSTKDLLALTSEGTSGLGLRLRGGSKQSIGRKAIVPIDRLRGIGIFFDKTGDPVMAPSIFVHFLTKFRAVPTITVFLHIRALEIPTVPVEERFSVSKLVVTTPANDSTTSINRSTAHEDIFYIILRHGYTDNVIKRDLGLLIYEELRKFVTREMASQPLPEVPPNLEAQHQSGIASPASAIDSPAPSLSLAAQAYRQNSVRHYLALLKETYEEQVVYIIGKEQMRLLPKPGCTVAGWTRRIALAAFLWIRSNTGRKVANWNLDVGRGVEVGFVKEL